MDDAWLAGLYEGEGCLCRRSDGYGYELVIAMTDEDVVRRVLRVAGHGTVTRIASPSRKGWKPLWRWRVGKRDEVRLVVDRLLPWMGDRRSEAMREFIVWHDAGGVPETTDAVRAGRAAYMRRWRAGRRGNTSRRLTEGHRMLP
jgi:hypothetical protein